MDNVLDNPAWNALLTGNHLLAHGNDGVKYFDKDVSPFIGLRDNTDTNFQTLYHLIDGDRVAGFISKHERVIPAQWEVVHSLKCFQMVYNVNAGPVDVAMQPVALTDEHIPQMLALTKLTNPGPFAQRTIDFGHYYGFFDGDELVAMAGQRMNPQPYAEISAVCTHPDYLGKGYARQLLAFHINRIMVAGGVPMLHVRHDNDRAVEVYKRVGFGIRTELFFYILKKVI